MADDPDLVGVLLGASSITELLDNIELLDRIGLQDERIAKAATAARSRTVAATERVSRARREALATERAIAQRTAEQRAVRDRLVAARDAVASAQAAKQSALDQIRQTTAALHEEVEQLEAESAALAAKIQAASSATTGTPSASGLIWPVSGPITSGFGPRGGRMHEGIDIAVPEGTPVHAAAAGTVIYAGWLGGYGNLVVVDHGGGLSTAYAHNSAFASSVGQTVAQGDTISLSGNTGHSTGPHVHFEVRVNGTAVDPLGYL
jgi:murein DD-endopeptidase MepM/ murein hydrolase activator NlpD